MTDYHKFLYLKKRNYLFLAVIFIFFSGCKTKYATKDFIFSEVPSKPDYSKLKSWAAHPEKNDSIIDLFYNEDKNSLKADVFYIYPTLLTDKNDSSWNSDLDNEKQKQQVKNVAIKYQASAWASAGKIYSPYYRQVHYRSFYEPYTSKGGRDAGKIAYNDIKEAFEYYLKYLKNVEKKLFKISSNEVNIFGSTISAKFLFEILKKKVKKITFVDENPHKINKKFFGKKIIHPSQLKNDSLVLMSYGLTNNQIINKLNKKYNFRYIKF